MLVEFFDRLLDILDTEPVYRAFLLDGQTVPIEDYLEIRPEARERIVKHVAADRLQIGPWYTDPEGFIVGGESLVRNLLYGHKVAREFGEPMKVGYTPFSYGQNSQMPQIYRGFEIDSILFYHGVSHEEVPNEFLFEGADGTRIFASQMSSLARYNFYHYVYRPTVRRATIRERDYDVSKGGLPFHLCGDGHERDHHYLLDPELFFDKDRLRETIRELREREAAVATTKYLSFMMGHDSSLPTGLEIEMIREAKKTLGADTLLHSTLPDYVSKVKTAAKDLRVLKGERRTPKKLVDRPHLFSDVLSARSRLKRANALAETLLQRATEPFCAIAWALGAEYPARALDLAWKTLLKCHAHDSIAGSGVDDIERDVSDRLRQAANLSNGLLRRALQEIQIRIDNLQASSDDTLVTVFNPSPYPRTEVVGLSLDLPPAMAGKPIAFIEVGKQRALPVQILSQSPGHAVVNHPDDATLMMNCEKVDLYLRAEKVPGLGYSTFRLRPIETTPATSLVTARNTLENEYLRATVRTDGTIDFLHKETKRVFEGLHYFEDAGEAGHAWMRIEPACDRILTSHGFPVSISLEEEGPLLSRFRIDYEMRVPAGLEENGGDPWRRLDGAGNNAKRVEETVPLRIRSDVTLRKGSPYLEVVTRFDNRARNHRLRAVFPTRLPKASHCAAESAFDVVEREIAHSPSSPWYGSKATFPMQRFVDVSDGRCGLALLNDGLREYEITQDEDRAIAVTLLRAFEVNLSTVSYRWETRPEMNLAQSPGEHEFRYALFPHSGDWNVGGVCREAEAFTNALIPAQVGPHDGYLPTKRGFLEIEPDSLVLSAFKRSEDGKGWIVRFYNPTTRPVQARLKIFKKIVSASLVNLEEKEIRQLRPSGSSVALEAAPKKIVTVKLVQ